MNLNNEIDSELWLAISKNYDMGNYKEAIMDSIFFLTETIRNKSGLEGDGSSLIGKAFGSENPKIKLNELQTDSQKDVQKGIQDILRGIYTGIRNPRSHDVINDDRTSADSIIVFINYLLGIIDQSKLSFEVDVFLRRVFDPYFVDSVEYCDLLIKDIPKRKRVDIAIETIRQREKGNIYALRTFMETLMDKLEFNEVARVCNVAQEILQVTTDRNEIKDMLLLISGKYWKNINEVVRLRIENLLYDDFRKGTYDIQSSSYGEFGELAALVTKEHLNNFYDVDKWICSASMMLKSDRKEVVDYINKSILYT